MGKEHPLAPLSSRDEPSLPPCAAGDFIPIFKLIFSICCCSGEIHPGKPGPARHGVPHRGQRGILTLLWQMGSDTSPVQGLVRTSPSNLQQRCFCQTLGLERASSDSGSLFDLGKLFSLFCVQISLCKTWLVLQPGPCLFSSLACCVSDIPAEIRLSLHYSSRKKLGASEMQTPHTPWASITNPPPLPVFTGHEQETNQKTSKTKD